MKMRDIKFRAWDAKKKEWLLGYEMKNLGGFSLFGETMMLGEWSEILDTYIFNRGDHDIPSFEDLVVMQYTGLKDKNGKECFESDLVKLEGMEGVYEVVFENAGFYGKQDKKESLGLGSWYKGEKLEVIGNIYENPELLK